MTEVPSWATDPAIVVASLAGLGAFLLVLALGMARTQRIRRVERRETKDLIASFAPESADVATLRRAESHRRSLWVRIAEFLLGSRSHRRLESAIALSGRGTTLNVVSLTVQRLQWAALGFLTGVFLGLVIGFGRPLTWWLIAILSVGGFMVPRLRLTSLARERNEQIQLSLPEALDLLNLCVGAGLGLQGSLQMVARYQRGPVAAEFTRVLQEMSMGKSRSEAFGDLTQRVSQPDLIRFAHALIQVDRLGIPLSSVIDEQAKEMRARRTSSAREQAQQVGVKILLPLVVCFLPGLFVIVVGPALISIWRVLTA